MRHRCNSAWTWPRVTARCAGTTRSAALITGILTLWLGALPAVADPIDRSEFSQDAIEIDFDLLPDGTSVPSGTSIDSQYAELGVVLSGQPSDPEANADFQQYYGPLASPPNVLLASGEFADKQILLTFVDPTSGLPAPTSAVGADVIFRDTGQVVELEVFDDAGTSLGSVLTPPDTGSGDEVFLGFEDPIIFSAAFLFDRSDVIVGIDNLIFEAVGQPFEEIEIDIKPGSDPNSINPSSRGVIPVAILTTEDFDALAVDAVTVRFGPAEAEKRHKRAHVEDVDGDGDLDLLLHFRTQDTGIALGDTEACLTGQTYDGVPVEGCDSVRTVPPDRSGVSTAVGIAGSSAACGLGAELAMLLPLLMCLWRRRAR